MKPKSWQRCEPVSRSKNCAGRPHSMRPSMANLECISIRIGIALMCCRNASSKQTRLIHWMSPLLQNLILEPIFGIKDMRGDARLDYIAGVSGDAGIKQKCSEGWKVVFACYATSIEQLMKVADADLLMPPKSTYFDPKPRSGIFVRLK